MEYDCLHTPRIVSYADRRHTPHPDMTITVLATPTTETKRRKPLTAIDMVTSRAQARPPPSAAGSTGRDKGKRANALASTDQDGGGENAKHGDKKRKAGE